MKTRGISIKRWGITGKALGQTFIWGWQQRKGLHRSSPRLKTEEMSPVFFFIFLSYWLQMSSLSPKRSSRSSLDLAKDSLMKMSVLFLSWLCSHEPQGICWAPIHFMWHALHSAHWSLRKRCQCAVCFWNRPITGHVLSILLCCHCSHTDQQTGYQAPLLAFKWFTSLLVRELWVEYNGVKWQMKFLPPRR